MVHSSVQEKTPDVFSLSHPLRELQPEHADEEGGLRLLGQVAELRKLIEVDDGEAWMVSDESRVDR